MVNNGKTTFMPYSPNPFPFKYIEHAQIWNHAILITYSAHNTSEYIIHGQYPITSSIPIILTSSHVIDLTDDTTDSSSDELSTGDIILTSSDESSSTVLSNTSSKLETNKRTSPNEENSQNRTINKKIKNHHVSTQQDSKRKFVNNNKLPVYKIKKTLPTYLIITITRYIFLITMHILTDTCRRCLYLHLLSLTQKITNKNYNYLRVPYTSILLKEKATNENLKI